MNIIQCLLCKERSLISRRKDDEKMFAPLKNEILTKSLLDINRLSFRCQELMWILFIVVITSRIVQQWYVKILKLIRYFTHIISQPIDADSIENIHIACIYITYMFCRSNKKCIIIHLYNACTRQMYVWHRKSLIQVLNFEFIFINESVGRPNPQQLALFLLMLKHHEKRQFIQISMYVLYLQTTSVTY